MKHSRVKDVYRNKRVVIENYRTNAYQGEVVWSPAKSVWISLMYCGAIIGGSVFFSWQAFLLFILTSGITLCAGHSVGMHRKLIHHSFECPRWLEKTCVYLGTLVGLGGPFTMMHTHDLRDWAQRQRRCHDYYAHRRSMLVDAFWQMHCEIRLKHPPKFIFDKTLLESRFYRCIEKTAMLQQIPWAILFYALGGWGWVFWGVCVRVSVSVTGHWLIGYIAHNFGHQHWLVQGASVQGYDVKFCSLMTFGESWHNNHHAFPGSARLGIYPGQLDPGWWLILFFKSLGLATNIRTEQDLPRRAELKSLG